jgi:hypothetical protein
MVLLAVGFLVSLPTMTLAALWSLMGFASGSLLSGLSVLALGLAGGLAFGALFFVGAMVAEYVSYSRNRVASPAAPLWNWCFGVSVIVSGIGVPSLLLIIVTVATMPDAPALV